MRLLQRRRMLFPIAAFAAVGIYLIWWVTYAGIHFAPRFSMRPPGASGELAGASIRLLSLTRADRLADVKGGRPELPEPGAVWIVAELEAVQHDSTKDFLCDTRLLGPEQRLWPKASLLRVSRALPYCDSDLTVGEHTSRFESIFMVPARYADQLSGIALMDTSSAARTPVIRPAPG
jgi:hypothetical protein